MSLPTEAHVEKWLHDLGTSDEAYAQACATFEAAKERLKVVKAENTPREGTVQERENAALTSDGYQAALKAIEDATYQKKLLELKRKQWELGIDVWRSLNANQRRTA